jgi:uncharacterized membrane protein
VRVFAIVTQLTLRRQSSTGYDAEGDAKSSERVIVGGEKTRRVGLVRASMAIIGLFPLLQIVAPQSFLQRWFSLQCHGRLDRSVALFGHWFPVCSRCLGIYLGLTLGALLPLRSLSMRVRRAWLVAAAALMVLEVVIQDWTNHPPYHAARILTGVLLAWPVAQIVVAASRDRD